MIDGEPAIANLAKQSGPLRPVSRLLLGESASEQA